MVIFHPNIDPRVFPNKLKSVFKEFDIGNPAEELTPEVFVVNAHYNH
jgi:hypothetical protein